jgi:transcription antitermination factor NusG
MDFEDLMDFQVGPSSVCHSPAISLQLPRWYVAYTYPRHEKAVADQLAQRSVETFLPTYTQTSHRTDRRVKLELPLFPGYVFARICVNERLAVISVPSVIRLLSFKGAPVPVSDAELDAVRSCVGKGGNLVPHRFIAVGERVRVREGVFEGLEGIVVRNNNSSKLVVTIALIHQSVAIEIGADLLEHVQPQMAMAGQPH